MTTYLRQQHTLTFAGAEEVTRLARAKATVPLATVVVDASGNVLLAQTADGSPPGSYDAALMKARSAAHTGMPTHLISQFIQTLPPAIANQALSLPNVCAFQGGMPIKCNGTTVGGVGIAGGSGEQDIEIATHASNWTKRV
jgi:uncharacterized protein GlcG (DUF336 family)